ncbi:MAG: hypothetical protein EBT79_05550 [Actinobacteria bacterium]|jgi:hypothetical protein|nr:hypothetical protein [Actinomycetota bacterium]NBR66736.1 hypothetical protein [Actinomycetota bacterium]
MTSIPSSGHDPEKTHIEGAAVFKSDEIHVQKFNAGTNSAVSEAPVERADSEGRSAVYHGAEPAPTPLTHADEDDAAAAAPAAAGDPDSIGSAAAKVDEMVQAVEARQSQIEEAHRKAEATLTEVNRIAEALTLSNALRERIDATVARTRRLRSSS